ncbi:MAG: phage integrase SAM-like domain-containing protein [gamma proteobacterium endosymbiont of Lamellibrachia anaximandri]|nr:phage integrase SAM-like domain-containing protein [gamma proteobacterium endosymbiont of Lamellibrachia anaximandri]
MRHYIKIGKWFHYKRRVPKEHINYYQNTKIIQVSLKTTSESVAIQRSTILDKELQRIWSALKITPSFNKDHAFEKAVEIAQTYDFLYRPSEEIATIELHKIINRAQSIEPDIETNEENVSAILGGYKKPHLSLEDIWDDFFSFNKANLIGKTDNQLRKWKNQRLKAIKNFIDIIGNLSVEDITRDHILTFRAWWANRLQEENMSPNSPNKDLTHLKSLLFFAQDNKNIKLNAEALFARMHFREIDSEKRPFETNYILETLLNHNNLKGLNEECRYFLYAFADTGARPSELVGLNPDNGDIRLDTDIPYIYVRPNRGKELKNRYSKRQIPLVGASLYAFKHLPNGFKHYYQKPDQLSATLNKFLRVHDLLPSENHTVYSLRHSFEDRLTSVEPPDKVQAALMGHKYDRPRYGDGPSLEQKHKWIQKIAFDLCAILGS